MPTENTYFTSDNLEYINRAFLAGDAVKVSFFVRNTQLILAEESYFFLMASMRKMRMNIPLSYTLDFFHDLFQEKILDKGFSNGVIEFLACRNNDNQPLQSSEIAYYFSTKESNDFFELQQPITMDLIKEINVNTNLLSNIKVHCPENVYAEIYAKENDLDDVILLNPSKRIARSVSGNLLFLKDKIIKVPKQSEGAYISPLMENLITFIHKNNLAEIVPAEMIAFESQKADEILMISDEKGFFPVTKIRNKTFGFERFSSIIEAWNKSL